MGQTKTIGDYRVADIEMLDGDTCLLSMDEFKEGSLTVGIAVEKWIGEGTWHFLDNYFDEEYCFLGAEDSTHLTDKEKEECMEAIEEWISENVTTLKED